MPRFQPRKVLSHKVAVVYGETTPISALVCLELVRQGARLLLLDEDGAKASFSRDLNLLWAGLDANSADALESDPWGAKPVAASCTVAKGALQTQRVIDCAQAFFRQKPDFVVATQMATPKIQDLNQIYQNDSAERLICIQPWGADGLHGEDLTDIDDRENLCPDGNSGVVLYTFCNEELLQRLSQEPKWQQICRQVFTGDSEMAFLCKTDDWAITLSYILHQGQLHTASDFQLMLSDSSVSNAHCCHLWIEKLSLGSLQPVQKSLFKKSCAEMEIETEELDGYLSSASDLLNNNGTFDAVLQKSKDYPIDWWQGGTDCLVAMDDIHIKGMARMAAQLTFRWLVLGYIVIGFAVPKVLGWNGP